ncbi:MAG: redoxin domain-containing protein [Pirellulales bacterium]|nr:redoxin domain-containing protein [Pirellulales bacterium]
MGWLNTAGPIDLKDLRGKFVVLDFWTYCCINCMHVLPELKKLEKAYPNEVVVIGVHSAKFETEQDTQNIADAILRYEIEHPVVNDANHVIWDKYQVNSWPSLRIIDPEGNLVAGQGGEIPFEVLDQFFKQVIPFYRNAKLLDETPVHFALERSKAAETPLRYPGKILADEKSGRLFIADSNHNRIIVTKLDGTLVDTIGTGAIGKQDGDFATATFDHPQGMALLDETLYVADTENHLLRKVNLGARKVTTIAGIGRQGHSPWLGLNLDGPPLSREQLPERYVAKPLEAGLNSPWDLWIHGPNLYIAMAGPHQIWRMPLDESEIGPYAGNGREDIVDGPLLPEAPYEQGYSSFAQPSGLSSDGEWLYVADSEGSSIRAVPFDEKGEVRTVVGTSHLPFARLFTFGDVDGKFSEAKLQHALGVVFQPGKLYVADTYNNKIKEVDLATETVATLSGTGQPGTADEPAEFDEPAGLAYAAGKLYVADTNNHLIRVIDLTTANKVSTLEIKGLAAPEKPKVELKPLSSSTPPEVLSEETLQAVDGAIKLAVSIELPAGYKLNDLAPMAYRVEAAAKEGPVDRAKIGGTVRVEPAAKDFEISVPVASALGIDKLKVTVVYYYCQESDEGLCKMKTASWLIPVKVSDDSGLDRLKLKTKAE